MALQKTEDANLKGEEVDNISQKYGRNQSRERLEERSMLSQANESRAALDRSGLGTGTVQGAAANHIASGPILRPVSGKSNNSRYTA